MEETKEQIAHYTHLFKGKSIAELVIMYQYSEEIMWSQEEPDTPDYFVQGVAAFHLLKERMSEDYLFKKLLR